MNDNSNLTQNDITLIDFDEQNQDESKIQNPNDSNKLNIQLSKINQERIENASFKFRNKYIELEKQQIKLQIDQMIQHLNQMQTICEQKIQKFDQPQKSLQQNMVYLRKFTFIQIQEFIKQLTSFKYEIFPNNLLELYDLFEVKMGEFYQQYKILYFDMKMFVERCKFYLNEDNERDTKLISQIINN